MSLLSLKNHSGEVERQFKMVSDEKMRLQSDLDRVSLEKGRKETDVTLLTDQLNLNDEKRAELESRVEELGINLAKATSSGRKAENSISQLTAEQARFATEMSKIKRKHQNDGNTKDDEYRTEKRRIQQGMFFKIFLQLYGFAFVDFYPFFFFT